MHWFISMWTVLLFCFPRRPYFYMKNRNTTVSQSSKTSLGRKRLWENFFSTLQMDNLSFHGKVVLMGEIKGSLYKLLKPSDSEKKSNANIKPLAMKNHTGPWKILFSLCFLQLFSFSSSDCTHFPGFIEN